MFGNTSEKLFIAFCVPSTYLEFSVGLMNLVKHTQHTNNHSAVLSSCDASMCAISKLMSFPFVFCLLYLLLIK